MRLLRNKSKRSHIAKSVGAVWKLRKGLCFEVSQSRITINVIIWLFLYGPENWCATTSEVLSVPYSTCCHLCLTFLTLLMLKGSDEESKIRQQVIIHNNFLRKKKKSTDAFGFCSLLSCLMVILLNVWCLQSARPGPPLYDSLLLPHAGGILNPCTPSCDGQRNETKGWSLGDSCGLMC